MPCVLNGANEVAVYAFLRREISFTRIFDVVRTVMERHTVCRDVSLDAIRSADAWARAARRLYCRKVLGHWVLPLQRLYLYSVSSYLSMNLDISLQQN